MLIECHQAASASWSTPEGIKQGRCVAGSCAPALQLATLLLAAAVCRSLLTSLYRPTHSAFQVRCLIVNLDLQLAQQLGCLPTSAQLCIPLPAMLCTNGLACVFGTGSPAHPRVPFVHTPAPHTPCPSCVTRVLGGLDPVCKLPPHVH
jgi:hypothetical protein